MVQPGHRWEMEWHCAQPHRLRWEAGRRERIVQFHILLGRCILVRAGIGSEQYCLGHDRAQWEPDRGGGFTTAGGASAPVLRPGTAHPGQRWDRE